MTMKFNQFSDFSHQMLSRKYVKTISEHLLQILALYSVPVC